MIALSCPTKFHAFALAEQLHRHNMLHTFYTSYAYQKNTWFRAIAKRIDKEDIPAHKFSTNIPLAIAIKAKPHPYRYSELWDSWVASKLKQNTDYDTFIGWSGASYHSILQAQKNGKKAILERGSSHIMFQDRILIEEHKKFKIDFKINPRVISNELKEYAAADYISIPSTYVKNTFLEYNIPESKLIVNPYGASQYFSPKPRNDNKFRIVYVGGLTIQKGLIYLFEAINALNIPIEDYEVWLIGTIEPEIEALLPLYQKENWHIKGQVPHYELPELISQCDVKVQPSLQEGLSMVIPQTLKCGVPVIATEHTGGADVIDEGKTGYIVPIRNSEIIKEKIEYLYYHPEILKALKSNALQSQALTWDNYGDRYVKFLETL